MPETTNSSFRAIDARQARWAGEARCDPARPGYTRTLGDNLFLGRLTEATEQEFSEADGSETKDSPKRPAKMRALVSSSALAVNFFDPWREGAKVSLGPALGLCTEVVDVRFEYVCRSYPVGPRSPNLDLILRLADGTTVAVESKFAEPFRSPGHAARLSAKYLPEGVGLWAAKGMLGAQRVAQTLGREWRYLDAAQLLKHLLGLAHDGCAATLLYLWYDSGLDDAVEHRAEIVRFTDAVAGGCVTFLSGTYQEAFRSLSGTSMARAGWYGYMESRYFSA